MRTAACMMLVARGWVLLGLILTAGWSTGCLRSGEERARLDLLVGQAVLEGVEFEVVDGLATLRPGGPGEVELRAQAPVVELIARADPTATRDWRLTLANAMPDAAMNGWRQDGSVLEPPGIPEETDHPTLRRWRVRLLPGEEVRFRIAPPDADLATPWRFGVLSDIQDGLDEIQEVYKAMNRDPRLRFIVSTGDLTDHGAPEEFERFLAELDGLDLPFYTSVGNHDIGLAADDPTFHRLFGRHSFHFEFKGVAFSVVDSANASLDPLVYDQLQGWLDRSRDQPHVFVTHFPPLDPNGLRSGAFRSRAEAAKLLTLLARGRVDLCLYGHVHNFYAFTNADIPAYISGGGGAIPEKLDGLGRHYLSVEVDPATASFQVAPVGVK